ncbi:uncharacterized protein LTHEOB_2900 [Lasiodiplodia theobromae]|uniref:uncharacterized protein n=1 Tax=Lasiodiplodia theobromae TaxID=45133 RepID=UPI0015C32FDA|nr:uncharacterized protein LTHEOB_2900 [Lasiodiplodia theobromae]KAF4534925.1 hypothetical protein LTHEOB_2900 [Lasiodiplodia theobromae]
MAEDDILEGTVGPPDPPSHSTPTPNTDEPNLTPDTSRASRKKRKRKSKAHSPSKTNGGNDTERPATPQPHEGEEKPPPPQPPPSPVSHGQPDPPRPPLGKLQGKVVVLKDRAEALRFAEKYSNRRDDGDDDEDEPKAASILPLFTDGSASHQVNDANDHYCSAAVVHRAHPQSDDWLEHGFSLLVTKHSLNAEVFGLGRALREGKAYIALHPEMQIHTLYIFTDLMTFLKSIWKIEAGIWDVVDRGYLEEFLALDAELAEAGIHVEYHWVPSHNGVEGNCRADKAAKRHRPDVLYPHLFRTQARATSKQQKHKALANKVKKRKNDEKESAGVSKKGNKRARVDSQE